jgi:YidC/Oxa1 family membrane protein insertase
VKQPVAAIAPGQSADVQARLLSGPEEERMLERIAPGQELVKD